MDERVGMNRSGIQIILLFTGFVLLIPLVAMQFTDEVNWSLLDFAIAAVLLFGTGLLVLFIFNKVRNSVTRIVLLVVVLLFLLLTWMELAVGLFGTPFSGS